jgi:hypothetical protein
LPPNQPEKIPSHKCAILCARLRQKTERKLTYYFNREDQIMQAIEFESILHNGQLKIPKHHKSWEGRHVKVILLADEPSTEQKADTVFKLLSELSDDFMEQGRLQLPVQLRDNY